MVKMFPVVHAMARCSHFCTYIHAYFPFGRRPYPKCIVHEHIPPKHSTFVDKIETCMVCTEVLEVLSREKHDRVYVQSTSGTYVITPGVSVNPGLYSGLDYGLD